MLCRIWITRHLNPTSIQLQYFSIKIYCISLSYQLLVSWEHGDRWDWHENNSNVITIICRTIDFAGISELLLNLLNQSHCLNCLSYHASGQIFYSCQNYLDMFFMGRCLSNDSCESCTESLEDFIHFHILKEKYLTFQGLFEGLLFR